MLQGISLLVLFITLVLAYIVLFESPTDAVYEENRDVFYRYAFICTITYFVTAYWALRRGKQKNEL